MEHSTSWSHPTWRSSRNILGSIILSVAGILLIATWATLWFSSGPRARAEAEAASLAAFPPALAAARAGCERGVTSDCNDLGVSYYLGAGTTPDDKMALQLFARACHAGSAEACNNQGALLEHRWVPGENIESVRRLYGRACEGGSTLACANLGALYASGRGVPRNEAEARRLFERACEAAGALGCANLVALDEAASRRSVQR